MNSPKTATANYVLQHLLTVHTDGLGANSTHVFNGSTLIGTANDSSPLAIFLDHGPQAPSADANVNGADGTQYFFQSFTPAPPTTLSAAFTTTAKYETIAQLITTALFGGAIYGARRRRNWPTPIGSKSAAVQTDMGSDNYSQAQLDLQSFISHLQAQANKHVTSALDSTLKLDAPTRIPQRPQPGPRRRPDQRYDRGDRLQLLQQSRIQPRRRASPALLKPETGRASKA